MTIQLRRFIFLLSLIGLTGTPASTVLAQWQRVNEPNGGEVLYVKAVGNNLFAGTPGTTVFRSTDGGASWIFLGNPDSTILPLFTIGSNTFGSSSGGAFISSDNGSTWTHTLNTSLPKSAASYLFRDSVLYAYGDGIFVSFDSSQNWKEIDSGLPGQGIAAFAVNKTRLFVGFCCDSGIFVSSNNGATWNHQFDSFGKCYFLYIYGNRLFASTELRGPIMSEDNGLTWHSGGSPGYIEEIFVDGQSVYSGTAMGVYRSNDSGLTWTSVTYDSSEAYSMAIIDSNIYEATVLGLFRYSPSNRKGELVGVPRGISSIVALRNRLYADDLSSSDEGISWKGADPSPMAIVGSNVIARGGNSGFMVSTNGGIRWTEANLPYNIDYQSAVIIGQSFFLAASRFVMGGADTNVFRSEDGGRTWSVVFNGLHSVLYGTLALLTGNRLIYAGSADDRNYACYESDDLGTTWHQVDSISTYGNGPFIPQGLCCLSPRAVVQIGSILLGIDSGKLYTTIDYGANWKSMDNILPIDSLAYIFSAGANGNALFVATKGGIFLSTDTGVTWQHISDAPTSREASFIAVSDKYLFAADSNYALWRRPLSDFGMASVRFTNPSTLLLNCRPNPIRQSTDITLISQVDGYAEISIVNALGVEEARLFSGELPAAKHLFTWDARNACAGIYWCVVRFGGSLSKIALARE